MSLLHAILCLAVGFLTCWGLIPLIRRTVAQRGGVARGSEFHHTHKAPVPRWGGLALAAGFVAVALIEWFMLPPGPIPTKTRWVIVFGAMAMFGLGFCDDVRPLGARLKLLGQIAIATGVYFSGIQIEVFKNPFTNAEYALGALSFIATVGWLVVLTNLINLIDGIDGLAGGISFMLMCLLANTGLDANSSFSTLLSVGMAGALIGFLCYNYPPAKIYMGDGGAYFLGFLIGLLSIVNSHKGSVAAALIAPVFALALPIVDVCLALFRRGLKGLPLFRPDRKHIHHRLLDFGLSRQRAVLVLYTVSFFCLFLAFAVFWLQGRMFPLLCGFLFLVFVVAARSFGFIKDWFDTGSRLGKSVDLRRETRYALSLSHWLELEAERCESVSELWKNYQFVVRKLGFVEVKLALSDGAKTWRATELDVALEEVQRLRHEMGGGAVVEFAADKLVLPAKAFELMAELAAETWQKAALRWQELNQCPLGFLSVAPPDTSHFRRKSSLLGFSFPAQWWGRKPRLSAASTSTAT